MRAEKVRVAMLGTFPPAVGGIATNIKNILKSPLKEEFNFFSFRTMSKNQGTARYSDEKMFQKIFRVIFDLFRFVFFLNKKSPRLVHINTSFGIWSFWRDSAYLIISKIFRKKILFQIHGGELNEFSSRYHWLIKCLIQRILKIPELIKTMQKADYIDILSLNENEAISYASIIEKQFLKKNKKTKELTLEAAKILANNFNSRIDLHTSSFAATITKKKEVKIRTFKIKPLRITGAGDAWNAGFLYGILENKSLLDCGKLGNYVASKCIAKTGARSGLPRTIDLPGMQLAK